MVQIRPIRGYCLRAGGVAIRQEQIWSLDDDPDCDAAIGRDLYNRQLPPDKRKWQETVRIVLCRTNRDSNVRLNDDMMSFAQLYESVNGFYNAHENRHVSIFADQAPGSSERYYVRFLVDRKHVVEYAIVKDRNICLSGLSLGIGPHYFGPADFWSYKDSERFTLEASTEAIARNLALLDEFFG